MIHKTKNTMKDTTYTVVLCIATTMESLSDKIVKLILLTSLALGINKGHHVHV